MDGRKREEEKLDSCRLKNSNILRLFFNRYFIKAKINEGYCFKNKNNQFQIEIYNRE